MNALQVKIKKLSSVYSDIPLPEYATIDSSGLDLRAATNLSIELKPGAIKLVSTDLSVEIPKGYEIQVRPRSGLAAKHGVGVLNSPGTIDADYRGEIKVILFNFSENIFTINRGDRIAQMVFSKVYKADLIEVNELEETQRGASGFGHTGKA